MLSRTISLISCYHLGNATDETTFARFAGIVREHKMVKPGFICATSLTLLYCGLTVAFGQSFSLHGQASSWLTSVPERSPVSQAGFRYIPELSIGRTLDSGFAADLDLSLNTYVAGDFATSQHAEYEGKVKPYRGWIRISSNEFEVRAGLQKINFGSATLFRPLMWFDRVDPRDPLQLTDGVYGLLVRYYFLDNANIWFWGLYGNDETKGWEVVPTTKKSTEYGGRIQTPLWAGELGATYHHREADFSNLPGFPSTAGETHTPESRFALDGKWDLGIGAWFEAAIVHDQTDFSSLKFQRQWTLGADYTFDVGNGLTALTEYFRSDNPNTPFASANGLGFSALSVNYPTGLLDRVSCIVYRDWSDREWYRLMTWQRTYDNWMVYLIGFWNPQIIRLYGAQSLNAAGQTGNNPFAGTGIQLMVVFNH